MNNDFGVIVSTLRMVKILAAIALILAIALVLSMWLAISEVNVFSKMFIGFC